MVEGTERKCIVQPLLPCQRARPLKRDIVARFVRKVSSAEYWPCPHVKLSFSLNLVFCQCIVEFSEINGTCKAGKKGKKKVQGMPQSTNRSPSLTRRGRGNKGIAEKKKEKKKKKQKKKHKKKTTTENVLFILGALKSLPFPVIWSVLAKRDPDFCFVNVYCDTKGNPYRFHLTSLQLVLSAVGWSNKVSL